MLELYETSAQWRKLSPTKDFHYASRRYEKAEAFSPNVCLKSLRADKKCIKYYKNLYKKRIFY